MCDSARLSAIDGRARLEAIRGALHPIVAAASELSPGGDEHGSVDAALAEALPRVRELATRAIRVLGSLADTPPGEELLGEAADLAFMGRWELSRKVADLQRTTADPWQRLAECASLHRTILRVSGAVEQQLAVVGGMLPLWRAHRERELRRALSVRASYTRLRHSLCRTLAEPSVPTIRRIRLVGINLAVLLGADVRGDMRVDDRRLFRDLQRRVLAWLADTEAEPEARERAGQRLLSDVAACLELLLRINDRAELREHDLTATEAAIGAIEQGRTLDLVALSRVGDRDDAVADLLGSGAAPAELLPDLKRIRAGLSGHSAAPYPTDPEAVTAPLRIDTA